ncbi:MAG: esterase [Muribaculaceae bacterium]|nr:esterase [Muribaculaceae bacterium]
MIGDREYIGGRECILYNDTAPRVLLLHALNVKERALLTHQVELTAAALSGVPAITAAFAIGDWKRELLPWPDPAISRVDGDGEHAGDTLDYLTEGLLPHLTARYGNLPVVLGGYSLGALFALWAATRCDHFDAIAAASPSVWITGWREFAAVNTFNAKCIYLSLGDREEHVRNTHIARVGDNIRFTHALLRQQLGHERCTLEWNDGGHFEHFASRNARAYSWCASRLLPPKEL